ncbi:ribonuclease HI [Sphingomonas sp. SUN019]|uniref:ribonuclease HI n=1 Tax=Sphingomonas sp. SUN019 TaxID=2937788 RepID=UPI0021649C3D|nr:ribonuclease HI [Sphingomonas sp. SUN019]UVO51138.1 ribonuclease HI [Sphingomonas sp. SUN019]
MKVFFDGGYRPEGMETAVVVRGRAQIRRDLGPGTSMDAEWLALIDAARLVTELRLTGVVLIGDSLAVIGQANGTAKCRGDYVRHRDTFCGLFSDADPPRIRYVKRSQNLAGIALARLHDR